MSKFVHMELNTSDPEAAKAFYGGLFAWNYQDVEMPDGVYSIIATPTGGIGGIQKHPMPDTPSHWVGYVGVDSIEASVAKAEELGGRIIVPETAISGMGKFAIINDPTGATFAVWEAEPKAEEPAAEEPVAEEPVAEKPAKKKAAKKKPAKKKAAKKKPAKKKAAKKKPAAKKVAKKKPAKKKAAKKVAKKKPAKVAKKVAKKKPAKKKAAKKVAKVAKKVAKAAKKVAKKKPTKKKAAKKKKPAKKKRG